MFKKINHTHFTAKSSILQRGISRLFGSLTNKPNYPKTFDKILIANRGEIAVRIIKTAKLCGLQTIAVYTLSDINALHKKLADKAAKNPIIA